MIALFERLICPEHCKLKKWKFLDITSSRKTGCIQYFIIYKSNVNIRFPVNILIFIIGLLIPYLTVLIFIFDPMTQNLKHSTALMFD